MKGMTLSWRTVRTLSYKAGDNWNQQNMIYHLSIPGMIKCRTKHSILSRNRPKINLQMFQVPNQILKCTAFLKTHLQSKKINPHRRKQFLLFFWTSTLRMLFKNQTRSLTEFSITIDLTNSQLIRNCRLKQTTSYVEVLEWFIILELWHI